MTHRWWLVLLVLLAPLAQAASVHAFLDRDHVSFGDTVTLNIQSSAPIGTPDLAALAPDFQILGSSGSTTTRIENGQATTITQLGVALKPLHTGTLTIPALDVAGTHTAPLTLHVAAAPSGGTGRVGDPAFMESSVLSSSPYVDQQTVYTVRLFYLPGVDGALGDPTADGARLIQLDRDHRYLVDRDGYTYKVLERSWALIPGRSGAIKVQGPEFQGQQMASGNPGSWIIDPNQLLRNPNAILRRGFPGMGTPVQSTAPAVSLEVRPAPAGGGKPWLPARQVQLRLTGLPDNGQVGGATPLTVTLSVSADGQPAGALPEPELPPIAGARAYPDQTRDTTDASGEWLHGTRSRSFAIVPDRNGRLEIPAITLTWWNVTSGKPERASIPARELDVSGVAVNPPAAATPPGSANQSSAAAPSAASPPAAATTAGTIPWRDIALASIALWVLAILAGIAWWWLRAPRPQSVTEAGEGRKGTGRGTKVGVGASAASPAQDAARAPDLRRLQREALDAARAGSVARCGHALLAWARALRPGLMGIGDLQDGLADPAQRNALAALQRARWQGGDAAPACAAVAAAFAHGFAWRGAGTPEMAGASALPPLYPS